MEGKRNGEGMDGRKRGEEDAVYMEDSARVGLAPNKG